MKSTTLYLTVRVDIDYPDNMDEADAKSIAVQEFDYSFNMTPCGASQGISVDSTEICDVNDEF